MAAEVENVLAQLKKIPGWERFPLPECVYKHFNIPKPKQYDGIRDWAQDTMEVMFEGSEGSAVEVRPPAPGGVREIGSLPIPEVEVQVKYLDDSNQTSPDQGLQMKFEDCPPSEACPEHSSQSAQAEQ